VNFILLNKLAIEHITILIARKSKMKVEALS